MPQEVLTVPPGPRLLLSEPRTGDVGLGREGGPGSPGWSCWATERDWPGGPPDRAEDPQRPAPGRPFKEGIYDAFCVGGQGVTPGARKQRLSMQGGGGGPTWLPHHSTRLVSIPNESTKYEAFLATNAIHIFNANGLLDPGP
jgi:hypothetical protein